MTCVHCKKEIERYYTLFNGTLVCPLCGEKAFAEKMTFAVTNESNNEFLLSEALFLEAIKEKDKKKMEKAVYHCSLASSMLHPMAYFKMGYYYDRDYTAQEKTEAFRTMIAYGYYSSLCYCNPSNSEMLNSDFDLTDIRKRAAESMLAMLKVFENDKTLYDTNKQKCEALGLVSRTDNTLSAKKEQIASSVEAREIMKSFKMKKQSPGVAFMQLTSDDFHGLFNAEFWQIFQAIRGRVKLYVCDDDGDLVSLSVRNQIENYLADNEGRKTTYRIAAFDEKLLKAPQKSAVSYILNNAFSCVNDTKVVLYADDIAVMKTNASAHDSLDDQILSFLRQYAKI